MHPLAAYHDNSNSEYREDCGFEKPPPEGKSCNVDTRAYHPCTSSNKYNFHKSAPCIFLKLNKVRACQRHQKLCQLTLPAPF